MEISRDFVVPSCLVILLAKKNKVLTKLKILSKYSFIVIMDESIASVILGNAYDEITCI